MADPQLVAAYYNECDPAAAAWLRELIKEGLIADGDVDERSIVDVRPRDLECYTQCHFFAGIGGWSYALRLAGWSDARPVWTGSCPCQPFSAAGKGDGFADERHLWPAWFHLIRECRPDVVYGEQVEAAINHGWLDLVHDDMEAEGYAFTPVGLPAAGIGAPHQRQRLYWLSTMPDADCLRPQGQRKPASRSWSIEQFEGLVQAALRTSLPSGKSGGVVDGVPNRVGQLRSYGNAIVPQVAAEVIAAYMEHVEDMQ